MRRLLATVLILEKAVAKVARQLLLVDVLKMFRIIFGSLRQHVLEIEDYRSLNAGYCEKSLKRSALLFPKW